MNDKTELPLRYKIKKWGVCVYAGSEFMCMMDNETAQKYGYSCAMEWCEQTFGKQYPAEWHDKEGSK